MSRPAGILDSNEAELTAIKEVTKISKDVQDQLIIIDSSNAISWASRHSSKPWKLIPLVVEIRSHKQCMSVLFLKINSSVNEERLVLTKMDVERLLVSNNIS